MTWSVDWGKAEDEIRQVYDDRCFQFTEDFEYSFEVQEYHYTLYYYDQAGNLVQTVPPAGVVPTNGSGEPEHHLLSRSQYNSLDQVLETESPDEGTTRFFYNRRTQLRFKQDAQQRSDGTFTFFKYDAQNRETVTGLVSGFSEEEILDRLEEESFPGIQHDAVSELVFTEYDTAASITGFAQSFLRGRISRTRVEDTLSQITSSTAYSYEPHGKVVSVRRQIEGLGAKRIDYAYDPISNLVERTDYQSGQVDSFYHKYTYDAARRLTKVETSRDEVLWSTDARYSYYRHGPLARTELGDPTVQGLDFLYTIQGWLKGVNSVTLREARDPGRDGHDSGSMTPATPLNSRKRVPKDVFGYTLGYFPEDFVPVSARPDLDWTASGNTVEVTDPGHGFEVGQEFQVLSASVDGISQSAHIIASRTSNTYQFDNGSPPGANSGKITVSPLTFGFGDKEKQSIQRGTGTLRRQS